MIRFLVLASASILALGPCSKSDDASDAAASASASAAPVPTMTAEAPKPAAPADAAKSCTVTPGKISEQGGNQEVEIMVKNTGTHAWHYCQVYAFAYDKSGTLLGKGGLAVNIPVAPGAETGGGHITIKDLHDKPLAPAVLATSLYELIATRVGFDDKSEWADEAFSFFTHTKATTPPVAVGKGTTPAKAAGKK